MQFCPAEDYISASLHDSWFTKSRAEQLLSKQFLPLPQPHFLGLSDAAFQELTSDREREIESVCVCACMRTCTCMHIRLPVISCSGMGPSFTGPGAWAGLWMPLVQWPGEEHSTHTTGNILWSGPWEKISGLLAGSWADNWHQEGIGSFKTNASRCQDHWVHVPTQMGLGGSQERNSGW